jgi:alcohol dehydrogenase YqhD (iron-dependent ADH family)
MKDFEYQCQTKLIFGKNTEEKVGEETAKHSKRILLHYGKNSIKESGLYDKVIKSLKKNNIYFVELSGVVPNPRVELVREGIELCRKEKLDFILAVGGGSVIDSAKAIAAGINYSGDVWDFFIGKAVCEKAIPIGTVLTIPAAGSETSKGTVITNGGKKLSFSTNILRPVFSILNPELTYTLPNYQTACGVTDMFAHVVERYFTNTPHVDLTDKLCEATFRSIMLNAPLVLKNPKDYDLRAEIMWNGTIAHNGILGVGREEDWASHRMEHELSAAYDIAHGAGLAIMIPAWMKFVSKKNPSKFVQFARNVLDIKTSSEEEAINEAINKVENFFKEIGMPTRLSDIKVNETEITKLAKACAANQNQIGGYVTLKEKEILEIYRLAL